MAVMRYEPWGVVSQLQNEINRVFGNLNDTDSSSATSEWSPAVDVREYTDRFQLLLDVPGVDSKDVEITLDNGVLTVSGNRTEEKALGSNGAEQPQQQRIERRLGRFPRRFILPDTADAGNVNASGRNGVLEIVILKQPGSQPRRQRCGPTFIRSQSQRLVDIAHISCWAGLREPIVLLRSASGFAGTRLVCGTEVRKQCQHDGFAPLTRQRRPQKA